MSHRADPTSVSVTSPEGRRMKPADRHWILVTLGRVAGRGSDLGVYGGVGGRAVVVLMTVWLLGCSPSANQISRADYGIKPSGGNQDFTTRCAQPGVVRCFGFDSAAEAPVTPNSNGWPNNFGI